MKEFGLYMFFLALILGGLALFVWGLENGLWSIG